MSLGDFIKNSRLRRGLSQEELAKLAKVSRGYISRLERGERINPTAANLLSISRALKVKPEELHRAAGYIKSSSYDVPPKTLEEMLKELDPLLPVSIPIVKDIKAEPDEVVDFAYWPKAKVAKRDIVGVQVQEYSMEPGINSGDIVFVDRDLVPESGDVILCRHDDETRLVKFKGEFCKQNDRCHIFGVVIEVFRRLK